MWGFWMRFWKNIDEIYAGRTLNIPLMGAVIPFAAYVNIAVITFLHKL